MFALGSSVVFDELAVTFNDPAAVSASQTPNHVGAVAVFKAPCTLPMLVIVGFWLLTISSGTSEPSANSRDAYCTIPVVDVVFEFSRSDNFLSAPSAVVACDVTGIFHGVARVGTAVSSDVLLAGLVFQVTPVSLQVFVETSDAVLVTRVVPSVAGI